MLALALLFLVTYAVPVIWTNLPAWLVLLMRVGGLLLWLVFVLDLMIRALLYGKPLRYLAQHPFTVVITLVPVFRPLRVLQIFAAVPSLYGRRGRFAIGRSAMAIVSSAALMVLVASVAVLDAERGANGATIRNFGDSMWWALTTVTTVGYGDTYPVTGLGRLIASGLMLVGVSLVGAVTATLGTWLLGQAPSSRSAGDGGSDDGPGEAGPADARTGR